MGLDARAARRTPRCSTCSATPASARLLLSDAGRAAGPCRRVEEVGRGRARTMPRCRAWPTARSAGSSTTPRKFTAREVRRGAALRRHHARPAQVRPRARRRGVAAGGESAPLARRLPQAARRRQPLPGAHRLCGAHVGAGDRRAGEADARRPRRHGRDAARWRCARKRAGCSCRPRSSRAGRRTRSAPARIAAPATNGAPAASSSETAPSFEQRRAIAAPRRRSAAARPAAAAAGRRARRRAAGRRSPRRPRPPARRAPGVPISEREFQRGSSDGAVHRQQAAPGTAATSSSGAKPSQWATILAKATLSSARP